MTKIAQQLQELDKRIAMTKRSLVDLPDQKNLRSILEDLQTKRAKLAASAVQQIIARFQGR